MEFILVLAVIAVLCIIFNVSLEIIITAAVLAVWLFVAVMTLFFIYFFSRLLFSERREAEFLRIEKSDKTRFKTARYLIDGEEYPCIFPEEGVFSNKLYRKDKKYHVMLNKRMKKVYDRFAAATCIIGFFFSIFLTVGSAVLYFHIR